jgi:protein-L-isoaspartate(D-aspartate) O-methyltransferase
MLSPMATQFGGRGLVSMDRDSELAVIRRAYAKQILAKAGVDDPRVENAFADIRREDFLGPGPWPVVGWEDDYVPTPSADPVYLYTDNVFGILPTRHINNGQPSGHALDFQRPGRGR